jgi:dTMP kinase
MTDRAPGTPRSGGPDLGPARGRFITFEGVEGCGKSTQLANLAERWAGRGLDVLRTREPGGTPLGERLRCALLDPGEAGMDPMAELLLYVADRAQHIREVIAPALDRGTWVLCDRYIDATLAYQGYARGLGTEVVLKLHARPPLDLRPDRTVLLDLAPGVALARARRRDRERGLDSTTGRFENETPDFHRRVRDGYLALAAAEPERFRVIAADADPTAVSERVAAAVADLVPALGTR